jgi:fucose permease
VSVSLGSIVAPVVLSLLAATAFGWRAAFAVGAAVSVAAVLVGAPVRLPAPRTAAHEDADAEAAPSRRLPPTLGLVTVIVALEFGLGFWLASYLADDVGTGRRLAAAMVSGLYLAQLVGRLVASRLARRVSTGAVLALAIGTALAGLPVLLAATSAVTAAIGLGVASLGIGAMFPLASSLHVGASRRNADGALGQVLTAAAVGQVMGPLVVAGIAQAADLRAGLLTLPALALLAAVALRAA